MRLNWLVAALGLSAAAAFAGDAINVRPVQVSDVRVRKFDKSAEFVGRSPSLLIRLHVDGPGVKGATSYGRLKIIAAVDDLGADLRPEPRDADGSEFHKIDPDGITLERFDEEGLLEALGNAVRKKERREGFGVALDLRPPSRKALAIKSLRGELTVMTGGERKVITVAGLKTSERKRVDDPRLKAAGLELWLMPAEKGDHGKVLRTELKGTLHAVQKSDVLEANGNSVIDGGGGGHYRGIRSWSYDLTRELDDSMRLELHVLTGQKQVIVPFGLKDLELP